MFEFMELVESGALSADAEALGTLRKRMEKVHCTFG